MSGLIVRGNTKTLEAFYRDGNGALVDPVDPALDIVDAIGVTVASLVEADLTHVSTGRYTYGYPVAADAPLGAWEAQWSGTIDGQPVTDDDGFTVIASAPATGTSTGGQTCSPWATSADACAPCDVYGVDSAELDDAMQIATDVLFNLTGRRWKGMCTDTIRPQAQWREAPVPRWWPASGASSHGFCSCHRGRETGCCSVPEIKLPGFPVQVENVVVRIDGEVLDADAYAIHDGRYLVRIDGEGWPCCQDLTADPATDENTFEVTYLYGVDPPIGGMRAAATLGCQYLLASNPDAVSSGACRLPKRITTITRAGTTIAVVDPMTLVKDGMTGLIEVDQWVQSILLGDQRRRSRVLVPGATRSTRRTS